MSCDSTFVPIIKRIGGPRATRRSSGRSSGRDGKAELAKSECCPQVPHEEPAIFRRVTGGEDTLEKTPGGVDLPVPKQRVKKGPSGPVPDVLPPPEQDAASGPPVPLPRTKKHLVRALSYGGPPPGGVAVSLRGELGSPSALEKQVSAAMAEESPEKTWTAEKDQAADHWLHVGEKNTGEEELDFGFVSVGGPVGPGRVQR